jgi:hypothetical protein
MNEEKEKKMVGLRRSTTTTTGLQHFHQNVEISFSGKKFVSIPRV